MTTNSKRHSRSFLSLTTVLCLVAIIMAGMLAGCGGDKKDEKKDNSSDIPLTQTFTNEEVGMTVQYPEGWVADLDSAGVGLGSSQAGMEMYQMSETDIGIVIEANPLEEIGAADLDGVFPAFRSQLEEGVMTSEVTNIKIGNVNAKRMTMSHPEADGILLAWMLDDGKTVVSIFGTNGGPGKLDTLELYALAIAKSVQVTPPAE